MDENHTNKRAKIVRPRIEPQTRQIREALDQAQSSVVAYVSPAAAPNAASMTASVPNAMVSVPQMQPFVLNGMGNLPPPFATNAAHPQYSTMMYGGPIPTPYYTMPQYHANGLMGMMQPPVPQFNPHYMNQFNHQLQPIVVNNHYNITTNDHSTKTITTTTTENCNNVADSTVTNASAMPTVDDAAKEEVRKCDGDKTTAAEASGEKRKGDESGEKSEGEEKTADKATDENNDDNEVVKANGEDAEKESGREVGDETVSDASGEVDVANESMREVDVAANGTSRNSDADANIDESEGVAGVADRSRGVAEADNQEDANNDVIDLSNDDEVGEVPNENGWRCDFCSGLNLPLYLQCSLCGEQVGGPNSNGSVENEAGSNGSDENENGGNNEGDDADEQVDGDGCPICMNPVPNNTEFHALRCGHKLHIECFRGFWAQGLRRCPYCRSSQIADEE